MNSWGRLRTLSEFIAIPPLGDWLRRSEPRNQWIYSAGRICPSTWQVRFIAPPSRSSTSVPPRIQLRASKQYSTRYNLVIQLDENRFWQRVSLYYKLEPWIIITPWIPSFFLFYTLYITNFKLLLNQLIIFGLFYL